MNEKATTDFLNWGFMIESGVVANKDGSFTAGWIYRGIDGGSLSNSEKNSLGHRLNALLSRFDSGWMFHNDVIRTQTSDYTPSKTHIFPISTPR